MAKTFEDIYYKCQKNPNLPDVKLGKFSAKNYRSLGVSATAHSVKSDNPDILKKWIAIKKIAKPNYGKYRKTKAIRNKC